MKARKILSHKKILSLLYAGIIVLFKYMLGNIYYAMNDDYAMDYISQGKYGNGYDEHLVFINAIIGKAIKALYSVSENINWFAMIYLIIVIAIFSVLFYVFWNKFDNILILPFIGLIEIVVLEQFTFTVIAYMCILTSILYFVYAIGKKEISCIDYFISISFFVLGVMVRNTTVLTASILAFPLIIYGIIQSKNKKSIIIVVCGCVICTIFANLYDEYCYKDSLWKEFKEYNSALRIIDYPLEDIKENNQLLEKNNLSENDIECFSKWIFADKEIFAKEKLIDLYNNNALSNKYNFNIIEIIKQMLVIKQNYILLAFAILSMLVIEKKGIPYIFGAMSTTCAMIAALIFRNRLVLRVMIPIYLIGFCISLYFTLRYIKKEKVKKCSMALLIVSLLISSVYFINGYKVGVKKKENRENYSVVREYIQNNQDILYLTTTVMLDIIQSNHSILEKGKSTDQYNIMPVGGWSTYSGKYYAQTERYHISNPERLILSLVYNDNVQYIGSTYDTTQTQLIIKFIEEHTGGKVVSKTVKLFENEKIAVYHWKLEK